MDFELAHGERAEAAGVAGDDDAVLREEDEREGAFELEQRVAQGVAAGASRGSGRPGGG